MLLNTFVVRFHVIFSSSFLLIAIGITLWSLYGWLRKKEYTKGSHLFGLIFLGFLYADLIMGFVLYFFLRKPDEIVTALQAQKYSQLKFWAVQHFSFMIFVVILSQIGKIFIAKASESNRKFKYAFFYYGAATLVSIISVVIYLLKK
jgi:hypothetical protein